MQKKDLLPKLENCSIGVIGLGYVGLPLAITIAKQKKCFLTKKEIKRKVIGFDLNEVRINELENGFDRNKIFSKEIFQKIENIQFTNEINSLINIDVFIITVPTPITKEKQPDLSFIKKASKLVGELIKNREEKSVNPIIIFESTVYPGVTEEICVPIIEKAAGKNYNSEKYKDSFYCGYSPERINPGDKNHTLENIIKITSGCNEKVAKWVNSFYGSFIFAGTHMARNIRVAEAAKIIENTQRDINIALINELAILFKKLNIDTKEVLDAASTKWNFHKYMPGLVGGHCIGVDPYYLTFKAKEIGYETTLISAGRSINDYMHEYLAEQILFHINKREVEVKSEDILLLGLSYKSNCGDIRNSKLIDLVEIIKNKKLNITIVDPQVDKQEVFRKTGFLCLDEIPSNKKFTVIILALYHKEFYDLSISKLLENDSKDTLIFDLTNNLTGSNVIHL